MKKLGGMFSLVLGAVLTAVGFSFDSAGTIVVGVYFWGALLLALKVIRRNQGNQLG
jgi:hypothetical protein